jgi:alkanesulfonate monooxygenase SsuD/methylene tetrahydromethanopterin reductase-like flavin-dependent oxidoreductase (luciferase family)
VLALAAQQTRAMKIGTGVNVPGLRLAPVTANGIATINRLAPGRTFIGLGTGHTAMRTMGQKPMRLKEFAEYIRVVKALIAGEEVDYSLNGETHPIAFAMREHHYIDVEAHIPLYVAGFGPKAQALAGELGEGLITGFPRGGTITQALDNAREGARRAGRSLEDSFYCSSMVTMLLLEPGESLTSDRVIANCGSAVMTGMHYLAEKIAQYGGDPPGYAEHMWKDYMEFLDAYGPEERHQKLHGSHYSHLDPAEARFLTPELIKASCIIGEPEDLIDQIHALEAEGLNQLMLYPPLNRNYRVIEDFAEQVMARL